MKKKILALTLAVTLVVSIFSVAFTVSAASTLKGDADGDGKVTTNDALVILRAAAGIEDNLSSEVKKLCDVNEDGYLTLFDARKILRSAAGLVNLEPTGLFKGYTDKDKIFDSQEELLEYFNTNINKVKSEKYGFTILKDTEMQKFEYESAKVLGAVQTENMDDIIQAIFDTVGSDSDTEELVVFGTNSKNKMSVEGQSYVSALTNYDVLGSKAEYDKSRGVVKITLAIPDTEKCDLLDSSYVKVFNTENLLGATETALNSILSGVADGTEIVQYKNAFVVAEFELSTGNVINYKTSYETSVYVNKGQNGIITIEGVTYETKNTVDYVDFCYD